MKIRREGFAISSGQNINQHRSSVSHARTNIDF